MKKRWPWLLIPFCFWIGAALFLRWQAEKAVAEVKEGTLSAADLEKLIADQKHLVSLRLFSEKGQRDAGALLNPFVRTDDGGGPDQPAPWDTAEVATALSCTDSSQFPACVSGFPPIDTSILSALMTYDTWDPASSGALQRLLSKGQDSLLTPLPRFNGVQNLAKLRLLQGLQVGEMSRALQEVRHLSELVWSTQSLIGEMIAISLLKLENQSYQEAVRRGMLAPDDWSPVAEDDIQALRRTVFGMAALYLGEGPEDALKKLQTAVPEPLGVCAAAGEAIPILRMERALFGNPWPGELGPPFPYSQLDAVVEQGTCRLTFLADRWKDQSKDLDLLTGAEPSEQFMFHVPYLRQYVGITLMEISRPSYNHYGAP